MKLIKMKRLTQVLWAVNLLFSRQCKSITISHDSARKKTRRPLQITCTDTNLTSNSCCGGCGFIFDTKNKLEEAVRKIASDPATVIQTYGSVNCWDVSSITDMSYLFYEFHSFNEPIGCWNVSKVTNMGNMFFKAKSFNQPIHTWNISRVSYMERAFALATSFDQPLDTWDTKSVVYMGHMFEEAANFNQPIGSWDVSNVTNMEAMFTNAPKFNQPIGAWNMSRVTSTTYMFFHALSFDQPLAAWDVSKVTTMSLMFGGATRFNQDLCPWYELLGENTTVEKMLHSTNCTDLSDPDLDTKLSFCQICAIRCTRPTVSPTSFPSRVPTAAQPNLLPTNAPTDNNAPTSNSSFAPTSMATPRIFPSSAPVVSDTIFR